MRTLLKSLRAYTFLELMVTVSILSIGIVGIYKVLLTSLDYQSQLSCRLYATNLMEHEIALLENQFKSTGQLAAEENGKVVEVLLDRRNVRFEFSLFPAAVENNIIGLLPVTIVLSWPDRDRHVSIKRDIYLTNLHAQLSLNVTNPASE